MVAEACAQNETSGAGTCDPSLVGPDVMVSIPAGKRTVSFEWLRDALRLAASAETSKNKPNGEKEASRVLTDARSRLAEMIQETSLAAGERICTWKCFEYPPHAGWHSRKRRLSASQSTDLARKDLGRFCALAVELDRQGDAQRLFALGDLSSGAHGDRDSLRPADLVVYPQAAGAATWPVRRQRPCIPQPRRRRGGRSGWNRGNRSAARDAGARPSTTCIGPRFPALNRAVCGRQTELALRANTWGC